MSATLAPNDLSHAIVRAETNRRPRGADLPADQRSRDTHHVTVDGEFNSGHTSREAQGSIAAVELLFHAAFLDDIENVRKATANRLGAMERQGVGGTQYQPQLDALEKLEHQAVLALQRAMRKHPLGPWVKRTVGVGEKQGARLIAAIGDPYIKADQYHDGVLVEAARPRRGPAELWAYCGYASEQKRRKGVRSNWNADAKTRAYLIAKSCIKQAHSSYRDVYVAARTRWASRDTTDMHKHNHALRCVAKAVLRDLFLEARRLASDHTTDETHINLVAGNNSEFPVCDSCGRAGS